MLPVYILIRTSNRPKFFGTLMETIKNQTYKNIVTIVFSDDPRDTYVTGDIIINGHGYNASYGNAPYNLYNNKLLSAIPDGNGWFHFMDDDDKYSSPDVIEKLVNSSLQDHINVARVERWDGLIFPAKWKVQKSFQTECFFLHTEHRKKGKWWGNKGGDHFYSKQLTRVLPINWIENLKICEAQEGKGHGRKFDKNNKLVDKSRSFEPDKMVVCLGMEPVKHRKKNECIRQGEFKRLKYNVAYELEQEGKVKITNL